MSKEFKVMYGKKVENINKRIDIINKRINDTFCSWNKNVLEGFKNRYELADKK